MRKRVKKLMLIPNEKIVIGEIMGGLGNQLFAMFTTIAYGIENNCQYFVTNIERRRKTYFNTPLYNNIQLYNKKCIGFKKYTEKNHGYDPLPIVNKIILNGYFQSYKYFDKCREKILQHLDWQHIIDDVKKKTLSISRVRWFYTFSFR